MENRKFTRIPIEAVAILQSGDETISGGVENLSLNGMFFTTSRELRPGQEVGIKLTLSGPSSCLSIDLNGIVKRKDHSGYGIEFSGMYLDVLFHLKHIVGLEVGDEAKIMQEFRRFMAGKASPAPGD